MSECERRSSIWISVLMREKSENREVRARGLEERDGGESRRVREEGEGRSEELADGTI